MIGLKCIVLPTDFSDSAAEAARYACELADRFGAELHVLYVIHDISSHLPDFGMGLSIPSLRESFSERKDHMEEAAIARLAEVLPQGWEHGKRVVLGTRFGTPFVEIVRYAKEHRADLIVMGTHGRSALAHAMLGSVAEKVVRKAPCPVLTVRAKTHAFVHPIGEAQEAEQPQNPKAAIRHIIEELYGPCPVNDFLAANAWAERIDWEDVKANVDRRYAEFPWKKHDLAEREAAMSIITDVRHDLLSDAGHKG